MEVRAIERQDQAHGRRLDAVRGQIANADHMHSPECARFTPDDEDLLACGVDQIGDGSRGATPPLACAQPTKHPIAVSPAKDTDNNARSHTCRKFTPWSFLVWNSVNGLAIKKMHDPRARPIPALPFLTDSVVENAAFCAALAGAFVCSQFCHSAPRAEDVRTKAKD